MFFKILFVFTVYKLYEARILHTENERPIVGVITEEVNATHVPTARSKIVASYVKFLEGGGARVVPIWIYKDYQYYEDIMSKINGVLLPGGGDLLQAQGYGRTGKIILSIAKKMNDNGDYFPIWGTCLGFELLNFNAADKNWMKACPAEDVSTSISFTNGSNESRLFSKLDLRLKNAMQTQKVAVHYHRWCLTPQNYSTSNLDKVFKVLALNSVGNITFVSVIEAFKYPFYGVTFHPEKVLYEWINRKGHLHTPHSLEAIQTSQYFANFFVNEAKKSNHHFEDKASEDAALIYNYNMIFTGAYNVSSEQTYYFS